MKEDWVECTLGDLLKLKSGFAFKSTKYIDEGIPVLRIGDIQDWNVDVNNAKRVEENREYDPYKVNKGDILIAMSGATTGKFGIYNSDEKAYQNQRVGNLIPHSDNYTIKNYIYYLLYSLKRDIEIGAYGGAQPNISASKIEALQTKLFPLPIQRAIVAKIEELFSSLDSGIADLKKAQEQLVIYRQAVLKKAFEGELTKEWREKQSDLPSVDELLLGIKNGRQKHYKRQVEDWRKAVKHWEGNGKEDQKPTKPQKPTNLDIKITILDEVANSLNVCNEWSIQPLAFISDNKPNCIVDGPFGASINVAEDYKEAGIPVIRMVNIRPFKYVAKNLKFIIEEKFNQLKRHNIIPKDVLIAKVGATIGDCCIYPDNQPEGMLSTTGSCRIRLDPEIYLPELLQYYIFSQKFKLKSIASQTAQPFLNMKVLKAYPVPFLTIHEQKQLIREIESRLSVCDKVEESIAESLEKAEALRQSILKKAFEGKLLSEEEIEKCKQEKDYEPASVLLERIKAEKKK